MYTTFSKVNKYNNCLYSLQITSFLHYSKLGITQSKKKQGNE